MKVCGLVNADVDDDKDIVMVEDDVIMVEDVDKNNLLDNNFTLNYFQKPMLSSINDFFKFHPKQPHVEKFFKSSKAYFRSNSIKRQWLSFDNQSKSLFCSVCLAFSSEPNLFTKGLSVWTHVYQRIEEHEASKTHMSCSESYLLHTSNKTIDILLFSDFKKKQKEEVKKNIQILQRVIDIVKLIGKRGLSYRAHRNESALSLNNPILDHGNFLDILLLLKKYDIVLNEHIDLLTTKAQRKANSGNSKGKVSKVTFISKTTVNMVIDSISTLIKKNISSQILEALMFSVQMDTTQDVSVQDQCSLIVRYVNSSGVHEKLLSVVTMTETKGKSFHEMLENKLLSSGLNIKNCIGNSTDGASNMQGQYNGFSAWLTKSSPGQVHVWCYSHVLNLVLIDSTKSALPAVKLFSLLNEVAAFFKESYKRMNVWKNTVGENIKKKLVSIGMTRWWSKEKSLQTIFGEDNLFVQLIISLDTIQSSHDFNPEIKAKARNLKEAFMSYELILTALIYIKIFKIVGPLSRYLQTSGIDLIKSQELVNKALHNLKQIQRGMKDVKSEADKFITIIEETFEDKHNMDVLIEKEFPKIRCRHKKKMADEMTSDQPILDAEEKFTVEVHNIIFDKTISCMEERFSSNKKLYCDLAWLSPNNFKDLHDKEIPFDTLFELSKVLKKFDDKLTHAKLVDEMLNFSSSWDQLKRTVPEYYEKSSEDDIEEETSDKHGTNVEEVHCKSCMNCPHCCYNVLVKYNLYSNAYHFLFLAYKYLLTLPCTQVMTYISNFIILILVINYTVYFNYLF